MLFWLLRFPLWNLLLFSWVYIWMLVVFSFLQPSVFFLYLCACCFNDNMLWGRSILVMSVWCPGVFVYLNGHSFLLIWEIFCYYFVEYIMNSFCLLAPLFLLQCLWFSDLFFWWSQWVLAYYFHRSWVFWLRNCSSVFPLITISSLRLRFCLLLVLVCWVAFHFVLYFCFILFSEVFHIMVHFL
jgi:hypothetical protein